MSIELKSVAAGVQYNCDVADARHGADYGLCTYLMKMREYFRWEAGLGFSDQLEKDRVGDWLTAREARWEELEDSEYRAIDIDGQAYDPFDVAEINARLRPHAVVYSAGLGQGGRPQFFLAELEARQGGRAGFTTHISGREHARGLSAAPAMSLGHDIFVRRGALRQYLWERYESWTWSRPDNAYARVLGEYALESALDSELERMTEAEIPVLVAHEVGEYRAGRMFGEAWSDMLGDLLFTPAELIARSVRDNLADSLETLGLLTRQGHEASLHLYMAALSPMRRSLWPGLQAAYTHYLESGDTGLLRQAAADGAEHWEGVARDLLAHHARDGAAARVQIAERLAHYGR